MREGQLLFRALLRHDAEPPTHSHRRPISAAPLGLIPTGLNVADPKICLIPAGLAATGLGIYRFQPKSENQKERKKQKISYVNREKKQKKEVTGGWAHPRTLTARARPWPSNTLL
jgi:hypothetical protein